MPTELSENFFNKIKVFMNSGVALERSFFSVTQKRRMEACLDTYKRLQSDPYMDIVMYLHNVHHRTYYEIAGDKKVIDFIMGLYATGERNISMMRVRNAANKAMRLGEEMNDAKALLGGAKLLVEIDQLDKDPAEADERSRQSGMPMIFTPYAGDKYHGKKSYDAEEMRRIRSEWGVKEDSWQEMVETKTGEYEAVKTENEDGEEGLLQYTEGADSEEEL